MARKRIRINRRWMRMLDRRTFLQFSGAAGASLLAAKYGLGRRAFAVPAAAGLSDPALQPKFVELAPNALDPGFLFKDLNENGWPAYKPNPTSSTRPSVSLISS